MKSQNGIESFLRLITKGSKKSSERKDQIAKFLRIDKLVNAPSKSSTSEINALEALSRVFINDLTIPFLCVLPSSIASSYIGSDMLTSPMDTLLKHEEGRAMLGYNQQIRRHIDKTVKSIKSLFPLNPSELAIFKNKLQKEITKEVINGDFDSNDQIKIDIFKILIVNKLISYDEYKASEQTLDDWKIVAQELKLVKMLATMIEFHLSNELIAEGPERKKLVKILFDVKQSIRQADLLTTK